MQAKTDGRPVECAILFQILHTRKDGSAVNPVMKEKMVSNFCIVVGGKHIMLLIYIYIYIQNFYCKIYNQNSLLPYVGST